MISSRVLPIVFALCVLLQGCGDDGVSYDRNLTIRILSEDGTPISIGHVSGGFDWHQFDGATDLNGYVHLPMFSVNWDTRILAANHYPIVLRPFPNLVVKMTRTPTELKLLSSSDVFPVKFVKDTLVHLDYNGDLVTFLYNEHGMAEVGRTGLARLRKQAVLRNDTLWYTTHSDGVYSYDISDPTHPRPLWHLPIEGYLSPLAVIDSLVIVGRSTNASGVEVYRIGADASMEMIGEWRGQPVRKIETKDEFIILTSWGSKELVILSLADPTNPEEVFSWGNPYYHEGVRSGDPVTFAARVSLARERFINLVLDISDPSVPVWKSSFNTQLDFINLLGDTLCVGYLRDQPALMAGNMDVGYWTSALGLSSYHLQWFPGTPASGQSGSAKPEFSILTDHTNVPRIVGDFIVMDSRLWRIVHD